MKKYLTLLFLVCAVALTFTGCGNSLSDSISLDYKVESSGSGSAELDGTKWEATYKQETYTLSFTQNTWECESKSGEIQDGRYTVEDKAGSSGTIKYIDFGKPVIPGVQETKAMWAFSSIIFDSSLVSFTKIGI
ncbi:MAG: hypothetical protein IAA16_02165 [Candidatus Treponema excrementipullorum]|uniref:Lipoprotein n=1 Tax=Candidatus Treponema excrementipullorum TaxID=2838768 RepID=A0A9E2L0W0_9SPIR|nr:hypothetical protein [Candidatus Treponema excrementipullorum]